MNDELPKGWTRCSLGELYDFYGGGTPDKKNPIYWDGVIPWATVKDIKGKYLSDTIDHITDEGLENSAANLSSENDLILVTRISPGQSVIVKKATAINQDLKIVKHYAGMFSEYSYFFFRNIEEQIHKLSSGTTVLGIRLNTLQNIVVAVPPYSEQHRIVAKIDYLFSELDKGVAELKKVSEMLDLYRQSLLKAAFEGRLTEKWRKEYADELESADQLLTRIKAEREKRHQQKVTEWKKAVEEWEAQGKSGRKPTKPRKPEELPSLSKEDLTELPELPSGWRWVRLGNCSIDIFDGPFGSHLKSSDYVQSGVRVIRLENIGVLKFNDEKRSYISKEKYTTISQHAVYGGDVIFSSFIAEGTKVTVIPNYIDNAVTKADCFCIRTYGEFLSPSYIASHLSTRLVFKLLESKIHGSTRPRINTMQLKSCPVPICSALEQKKIIEEIQSAFSIIDYMKEAISKSLQYADTLRQSILKKAFSGKLVPQDPNDGPALELLNRIKAEREKAAIEKKTKTKIRKIREKKQVADLLTVLGKAREFISAQDAFRQCGVSDGVETDKIETLYIELRDLVNSGKVDVERRGEEDWLKLKATQEA